MDIGGAEKVLHDLALGLNMDTSQYKIEVVCLYERGLLGDSLCRRGVVVCDRILGHRFDIRGALRFIDILKSLRPDILFVSGQTLSQLIAFIGAIFVKIPVKIIGFHSHNLGLRPWYRMFVDWLTIRISDYVICVSESQKSRMLINKKIAAGKIKVIYNGIDINKFRPMERTGYFYGSGNITVVGMAASLRKEKGLDILIKAAKEVLENCPRTLFVIAGKGPEKAYLKALASRLKVEDNIKFLGERTDVETVITSFDVACCSSRIENFPLSILEYMACGKCVVATRVGGIPEIIQHGFNGLLVNSGSPCELARGLVRLIKSTDMRKAMAINSRRTIEDRFTLASMIDGYKGFFEECMIAG